MSTSEIMASHKRMRIQSIICCAIIVTTILLHPTNAWCDVPSGSRMSTNHLCHNTGMADRPPLQQQQEEPSSCTPPPQQQRRRFLTHTFTTTAATLFLWTPANAAADTDAVDRTFVRTTQDFSYSFLPPMGLTSSQKPLKTHLDEVNFSNADYKFGITVDPVRISSLAAFGTAEQVAAKVVLAEVNRDGVFDVKLMEDPIDNISFYQLNYRSNGKRGSKRFVAKFFIRNNLLFALTAQCQEESYEALKEDILKAVDSFQIVS